jgi:hypothetical protein
MYGEIRRLTSRNGYILASAVLLIELAGVLRHVLFRLSVHQ